MSGIALSPSGKWIDAIRPDGSVCDAARVSLEARLMTVLHHLPLAAYHSAQDTEHVHRLRVSTRRAMAALNLYRDWLPRKRAKWVRKKLKKVRRAAGEARDLDVLAQRLEREYAERAANVLERIAKQRAVVQSKIVRVAEQFRRGDRFVRKTAKLLDGIERSEENRDPSDVYFRKWAAEQLATGAERFFASVPDEAADMSTLHQFRIRAKELRYSIELLAPAFGPELRDTHYRMIEELQERLGTINDYATARDQLRCWAAETSDASLRQELCELADEEVARLSMELGAWREWWTAERVQQLEQGLAQSA
jgi:CHAD domain-containing protein